MPVPLLEYCIECGNKRDVTFYLGRSGKTCFNARCRICRNKWAREHYKKPSAKLTAKRSLLKAKFNLSLEDYQDMEARQSGLCSVCGLPPKIRSLAVDHDHKTGRVRELLCISCNGALGMVKDNSDTLIKLAKYLDKHAGRI